MTYTPFYVVFILLAFMIFLELTHNKRKYQNLSFFYVLTILVVFATLRSVGVGSDDKAYIDIYSQITSLFDCDSFFCEYNYSDLNVEYGFFFLLSIFSIFSKSHFLLFAGIALPAIYLKLKSIKFFTPYFGASALIYFSYLYLAMELNAIRLGLATGIIFYAIKCFSEKKYWLFWLLYLLSISIHVSSVLMIIPIILIWLSPTRIHLILLSIVVILLSVVFDKSRMLELFNLVNFLSEKGNLYSNADMYNYAIPIYDLVNLKNMFISALCLAYFKELNEKYEYFKIAFVFFISATLLRLFLGDFAIVAGRSYAVLAMFDYIIIPMLAVYFFKRVWGFVVVIIYAFLLLSLNIFINNGFSGGVKYLYDYF